MGDIQIEQKSGRFCAFDRYKGQNRSCGEGIAVKIFFILWLL